MASPRPKVSHACDTSEAKRGWTKQRAYQPMLAPEAQQSTMVDLSTARAAGELGKTEPADPAGLMKPPPRCRVCLAK